MRPFSVTFLRLLNMPTRRSTIFSPV